MNNIEETLWNYIDGNCSAAEQKAIGALIERDEVYRLKYQELLNLNTEFTAMELEEPPMAFTYNVMEAIRTEHARQPLKAAINKRLILFITLFFIVIILVLLVYTLSNIGFSTIGSSIKVSSDFKIPQTFNLISKPVIEGFLFFDVVLSLFLFDAYLRNRKVSKQAEV